VNCPICKDEVNPYQEMQANGSFVSRCPRENCLAVLSAVAVEEPGTLAEVFAKEDVSAAAVVVDLPGKPPEVSGVIAQLVKRREWLEARMAELDRCAEELAVVNRMLSAGEIQDEGSK